MNVLYKNPLNGEFTVKRKASPWFVETFLESFEPGEYHAQDCRLKPWQYKGLMELAEANHWKMLSPKQWDVFRGNVRWEDAPREEFAHFRTNTKDVSIRISNVTGFVTINIMNIEAAQK